MYAEVLSEDMVCAAQLRAGVSGSKSRPLYRSENGDTYSLSLSGVARHFPAPAAR